MMMSLELCTVCRRNRAEHRHLIHEFRGQNEGSSLSASEIRSIDHASSVNPSTQGSIGNALRGDPLLRMILIRKGVITAEELAAVEEELKRGYAIASSPMGQP